MCMYLYLYFQIPDRDLKVRRMGQKVDPLSGELFNCVVYDPPLSGSDESESERGKNGEDEEKEDEEDEEARGKEIGDEFEDDLVCF